MFNNCYNTDSIIKSLTANKLNNFFYYFVTIVIVQNILFTCVRATENDNTAYQSLDVNKFETKNNELNNENFLSNENLFNEIIESIDYLKSHHIQQYKDKENAKETAYKLSLYQSMIENLNKIVDKTNDLQNDTSNKFKPNTYEEKKQKFINQFILPNKSFIYEYNLQDHGLELFNDIKTGIYKQIFELLKSKFVKENLTSVQNNFITNINENNIKNIKIIASELANQCLILYFMPHVNNQNIPTDSLFKIFPTKNIEQKDDNLVINNQYKEFWDNINDNQNINHELQEPDLNNQDITQIEIIIQKQNIENVYDQIFQVFYKCLNIFNKIYLTPLNYLMQKNMFQWLSQNMTTMVISLINVNIAYYNIAKKQ